VTGISIALLAVAAVFGVTAVLIAWDGDWWRTAAVAWVPLFSTQWSLRLYRRSRVVH
jgi:hypothetical protein